MFFMQHIFGIEPTRLCEALFFIVCLGALGSVFTATEGGISPCRRVRGSMTQETPGLRGQAIKRGTAPSGFGGIRDLPGV